MPAKPQQTDAQRAELARRQSEELERLEEIVKGVPASAVAQMIRDGMAATKFEWKVRTPEQIEAAKEALRERGGPGQKSKVGGCEAAEVPDWPTRLAAANLWDSISSRYTRAVVPPQKEIVAPPKAPEEQQSAPRKASPATRRAMMDELLSEMEPDEREQYIKSRMPAA